MKLALFVAAVVLALAQGTVRPSSSYRNFTCECTRFGFVLIIIFFFLIPTGSHAQAAPDLQTLTQYLEQIKNRMTEELNTLMNNPTLQEHTE